MRRGWIRALCLGLVSLVPIGLGTSVAEANRVPISRTAVYTSFCLTCSTPTEGKTLLRDPPSEGEIEGPCGLALHSGAIYVSDYYNRVIDTWGRPSISGTQLTEPGGYSSQIPVPVTNPPEGPCALAFDSKGALYVNLWHQGVVRLKPTFQVFDKGNATGLAVDAADNVYINRRTYVAVYQSSGAPVEIAGEPLKIGLGTIGDGFGLAVSTYAGTAGNVYVPDAEDNTVKVFDSTGKSLGTISRPGGFTSLVDTSLTVDPTNGNVVVVDNLQPGYEHPIAGIFEFGSDGSYLGQLPTCPEKDNLEFEGRCREGLGPVFGEPSGIAVDPSTGNLYVTDGNDEESNVFVYSPFSSSIFFAPHAPESESGSSSSSAASLGLAGAAPTLSPLSVVGPFTRSRRAGKRSHRRGPEGGRRIGLAEAVVAPGK